MKNTAYAFAQDAPRRARSRPTAWRSPSTSSRHRRWTARPSTCAGTTGDRIEVDGRPAPDALIRGGEGTRVATVTATRGGTAIEAGVEDLIVMKTTRSSFTGFPRDRYTTLPEAEDRLMATKIAAVWRYGSPSVDLDETFDGGPRRRCSRSSPSTTARPSRPRSGSWAGPSSSATRRSTRCAWCCPNLHHWRVDLTPFGIDDDGGTYIATTEPHGLIEATVRRGEG